jgi:hypothetical protein
MGAGGSCICVGCGERVAHQPGLPCMEQRCPACGKALVREGSEHHRQILEKLEKRRDDAG